MVHIAIIDYGMGNLRSVAKALEHVAPRAEVVVTQNPGVISAADRIVFPGQGSIGDCMRELQACELLGVIREACLNKPFLGLCLGPQALLELSEENGGTTCLGILPGKVLRFGSPAPLDPTLKVPHMGWNQVQQTVPHPLWKDIPQQSRFYFVHSYYLKPAATEMIAGLTHYGFDFTSAIAHNNIFAVQFHPEKSARWGLQLLANFTNWNPN